MRCYLLKRGHIVSVKEFPTNLSDEGAIDQSLLAFEARRKDVDDFEVWEHNRKIYRHSEQRWRDGERNRKESEERQLLLDARERMHALDAMRHWRDPTEREVTEFRTLRHHWDVLIDDNPCSG
jgi:hypothetical protein